jgi:NAD-dependent dihydropyrimidine dehydrogenase PreA subunit
MGGVEVLPILIDENICLAGCTICDVFCPGDIIHREARERPPLVKYPDECWFCGACALHCPVDAIRVVFPESMLHCQTDVVTLMGVARTEGRPPPPPVGR